MAPEVAVVADPRWARGGATSRLDMSGGGNDVALVAEAVRLVEMKPTEVGGERCWRSGVSHPHHL